MVDVGSRVGPYVLNRRLGHRGQGEVFLANHREGWQHALKIPHGNDLTRFRRELLAAQRVRSPRVARVWGFDLDRDPPYIAYEVIPGRTLEELLETDPPELDELLAIFRDVACGLADIHAV